MKYSAVILAAGDFPRKGTEARRILEGAARVVCCDSAADAFRRKLGREPTAVVGDCDSVKGRFSKVVRVTEQETNDLEKAIRYCAAKGWANPVILGATGKREDHALGNIFRAMEHGLDIVTDRGRFQNIAEKLTLRVRVGTPISVFANPGTRMKSVGLEWPLKDVKFENFHCATLNRAKEEEIVLETNKPAYVYVVREGERVRMVRG